MAGDDDESRFRSVLVGPMLVAWTRLFRLSPRTRAELLASTGQAGWSARCVGVWLAPLPTQFHGEPSAGFLLEGRHG